MKSCADCDHSYGLPNRGGSVCWRREATEDVVGNVHHRVTTCEFERARLWHRLGFGTCGREGQFWTPRRDRRPPSPPPSRPSR